jgi:hypothetical protein
VLAARGMALTALLALSFPASAAEGPDTPSPPGLAAPIDWSTLAYAEPAPTYRLRLGLEELFGVTAAVIGYVIQNPPDALPGIARPYYPWQKLAFRPGTWTFDADDFGTNMAGHVSAGTVYYLIARGNRVSIPEAFAWTFGASLLWELVEFKEPVSINDQVMTPVGGLALGEAFQQLSTWFDRGGSDPISQAFAFLFSPAKKLHDWIDRTVPDRDPRARGWHEFTLVAGAGVLAQSASGNAYTVLRFAGETRLFRAPGYGEPGKGRFGWGDGNASRIALGVTFSGSSVVDYLFDTETAVAGLYVREISGDAASRDAASRNAASGDAASGKSASRDGFDLFVAGTVGYEYGVHRWNLATGVPNSIALVRLPGLALRVRGFAGSFVFSAGLDAALTFGGVQPFALQPPPVFLLEGTALPSVLLANGYYFAIGFRGAPTAEVRWREASVGASMQLDLLGALTSPDIVPQPGAMLALDDQRWSATAWARWRFEEIPVEVGVTGQWRSRSGTAGDVHASEQERSLLGNLAVVF